MRPENTSTQTCQSLASGYRLGNDFFGPGGVPVSEAEFNRLTPGRQLVEVSLPSRKFFLSQEPRSGIIVIDPDTREMRFPESVQIDAMRGIRGDRYYISNSGKSRGTHSGKATYEDDQSRPVTFQARLGMDLINSELAKKSIQPIRPQDFARNFVLEGIEPTELADLVGRTFVFGGVEFLCMDLARPCRLPSQRRDGREGQNMSAADRLAIGIDERFYGIRALPLTGGVIEKSAAYLDTQSISEPL